MDALLLAAGLGSRLRPLTDHKPKALVEVEGRSLLEINLQKMGRLGIDRVVVNVHHFADQVKTFLSSRSWPVEVVVSDESQLLLDTGGALKKAAPLLHGDRPVLVHNVDILTTLDIDALLRRHMHNGDWATLAVSRRDTARQLLADSKGHLCGWHNSKDDSTLWAGKPRSDCSPWAFSGVAVVEPCLLDGLPEADHPYPVVPQYLALAERHPVSLFSHNPDDWLDVGKPETLAQAATFIHQHNL